jgi:hypothetical protein
MSIRKKCHMCRGIDLKTLSTGEVLCQNPRCMFVNVMDKKKGRQNNGSRRMDSS